MACTSSCRSSQAFDLSTYSLVPRLVGYPDRMHPSRALRMYTAQLTLFTRANCGLCDVAKSRLVEVQKRRTVDYQEVDIMAEGQKQWRDSYELDVPVLHVERVFHTYSKPNIVTEAKKLMHRFSVEEVEKLVDEAEQGVA